MCRKKLPLEKYFYNINDEKHSNGIKYKHLSNVENTFEPKNTGKYYNLYVKSNAFY